MRSKFKPVIIAICSNLTSWFNLCVLTHLFSSSIILLYIDSSSYTCLKEMVKNWFINFVRCVVVYNSLTLISGFGEIRKYLILKCLKINTENHVKIFIGTIM